MNSLRRGLIILFSVLLTFTGLYAGTFYDLGFSVLNDVSPFKVAVCGGIESPNINFSFDINPNLTPLSLVSVTDINALLYGFNENTSIHGGMIWYYDRATLPATDTVSANRSQPDLYLGISYKLDFLKVDLNFCYPLIKDFKPSQNLLDYFMIKTVFTFPRPHESFIDDLKFELRFSSLRRDFSIYISEPF